MISKSPIPVTVGRIVLCRIAQMQPGEPVLPAIVNGVYPDEPDTVDLVVFQRGAGAMPFCVQRVPYHEVEAGDETGVDRGWWWMDYQKAAANVASHGNPAAELPPELQDLVAAEDAAKAASGEGDAAKTDAGQAAPETESPPAEGAAAEAGA